MGEAERVTRIYLALGWVFGFVMSTFGIAATVAWVVEADLSATQLILMGSVLEGTVLLFEVPTGVVADRYSRKWSIVISWALIALGISGSLSTSFVVLMVAQFVWGVGFTFQSGAVTAWATDQLGRDIDDLIVRQARARSIGVMSGVIVGAGVGWATNLFVAIGLAAAVALATSVYLAVVMPERVKPTGDDVADSPWQTARSGWSVVSGYPIVRTVMIVAFLGGFGSEVIDRLFTKRFIDLGVPVLEPVVMIAVIALVAQAGSWWVLGRIERGVEVRPVTARTVAVAYAVTCVACVALAVGPEFAIAAAGYFVMRISRETIEPLEAAIVNRRARSAERATILSFHGQADALGQATGGPTMALVAFLTTQSTAMAAGAAMFGIGAMVAVRRAREDEPASV